MSDFSKLKTGFYHGMTLYKLKICGTITEFFGIQGYLKNADRSLTLKLIGSAASCKTFDISPEDYIKKI